MAIRTWNPFTELEALRREVERAFESFGEERAWPYARAPFLLGTARAYPLINMSEDKDNLYVEAMAPGLNTGSLEVTVHNGALRISGEKMRLSESIKAEAYHRNEREAGKFTRTIGLPVEIDADKVLAEYKDGMLHITLPKAEAAKPRQISVNVG